MAYSLSPLADAGHRSLHHRPTSPLLHQPISKREKRRTNMEERFAQIGREFNENRDLYYRKQLQDFQIGIDAIRNADLYANKTLDDFGEDTADEATASAAVSTQGSARTLNSVGSMRHDAPRRSASYAQFSQTVNDTIEQRDVEVTTIAYHHNCRVEELLRDNEFNVSVAHEEHHRLVESLRRRLILSLNQKKTALQKEKEKLDAADANALLYHPGQFTLTNTASPGGPQSNRKTRHTRHRLEVDDLDAASGNNKRKRKVLADLENGSPAPAGREVEPMNAFKEANAKLEYHQVTGPFYSVDRLFSQRELDVNLQLSTYDVVEDLKRRRLHKDSHTNLNSITETGADNSDSEENADPSGDLDGTVEDALLAAPEMERIPTNASQHLTRSTRGLLPTRRISGPDSLGYLAGRAAGAATIGNTFLKERKREDEERRAPPLTESEQDEDLAMIQAAIQNEDAGRDKGFLDSVLDEMGDYVGTGSVDGEEEQRRMEE